MTDSEEKKQPSGDGSDFIRQQSDLDQAKNEKAKEEEAPGQRRDKDTMKTDVSHKKTGGGKQTSPGT